MRLTWRIRDESGRFLHDRKVINIPALAVVPFGLFLAADRGNIAIDHLANNPADRPERFSHMAHQFRPGRIVYWRV